MFSQERSPGGGLYDASNLCTWADSVHFKAIIGGRLSDPLELELSPQAILSNGFEMDPTVNVKSHQVPAEILLLAITGRRISPYCILNLAKQEKT